MLIDLASDLSSIFLPPSLYCIFSLLGYTEWTHTDIQSRLHNSYTQRPKLMCVWCSLATHAHTDTHTGTASWLKRKLCSLFPKGIAERMCNFKGRLWGHELATLQYMTHASLPLFTLSPSLWVLYNPGWPSLCSCNSLSKQGGPWLGRNGREGSPRGERERCVWVCVCACVWSWIRSTSFNSLQYPHISHLSHLFSYIKKRQRQAHQRADI